MKGTPTAALAAIALMALQGCATTGMTEAEKLATYRAAAGEPVSRPRRKRGFHFRGT